MMLKVHLGDVSIYAYIYLSWIVDRSVTNDSQLHLHPPPSQRDGTTWCWRMFFSNTDVELPRSPESTRLSWIWNVIIKYRRFNQFIGVLHKMLQTFPVNRKRTNNIKQLLVIQIKAPLKHAIRKQNKTKQTRSSCKNVTENNHYVRDYFGSIHLLELSHFYECVLGWIALPWKALYSEWKSWIKTSLQC